jgi:hypothetical protein
LKVLATNSKGSSTLSNVGNGAIIVTYPDPPISLTENTSVKTPTTLGIRWSQATENGGATVQDYRVTIAPDGGAYTELGTGLTGTSITASDLTTGVIYHFRVESRNVHGYSNYSEVFSLLSAYIPEAPTTVTTSNLNDLIIV